MDESEIWLSEEDEEEDHMQRSTDPRSFILALTDRGQRGGKHAYLLPFSRNALSSISVESS